jgi:hypothetical protein
VTWPEVAAVSAVAGAVAPAGSRELGGAASAADLVDAGAVAIAMCS